MCAQHENIGVVKATDSPLGGHPRMTVEHIIFIPSVFMAGLAVGYMLGARAVRDEIRRKREAQKR